MASKADVTKQKLIEEVVSSLPKLLTPSDTEKNSVDSALEFTRQFYLNVPPNDILSVPAEDLAKVSLSIWRHGAHRKIGGTDLRVFNPTLQEDGWKDGHTIIEIVNDDMPFLVDTITTALNEMGHTAHLVIHPVVKLSRDMKGNVTAVYTRDGQEDDAIQESWMHIQIDVIKNAEQLKVIADTLASVLVDNRAAVDDWLPMQQKIEKIIPSFRSGNHPIPNADLQEAQAFLDWLKDDHFTFLGYREYLFEDYELGAVENAKGLKVVEDSGLGMLRDADVAAFTGNRTFNKMPDEVRHFLEQPRILMVTKSNKKSTVHRGTRVDAIFIKMFDEDGHVIGERLFTGLFTSSAYNQSAREIPYLRRKIAATLTQAGFEPNSHSGKKLIHILETFPRDELFQITQDQLFDMSMGILHLQDRQRTALFVRKEPFNSFISALVYVPRDRYNTDLRHKMRAILEETYKGDCIAYSTEVAESVLARIHFIINTTKYGIPDIEPQLVEQKLAEAARDWRDGLYEALEERLGKEDAALSFQRFMDGFPTSYRENFTAAQAAYDVQHLLKVIETNDISFSLYHDQDDGKNHLKLYHAKSPVPLADTLPTFDNLGLRAISEIPYAVKPTGFDGEIYIHDFVMDIPGEQVNLQDVTEEFGHVFHRVWHDLMVNDGFNNLVLSAGLDWKEIVMLRAYAKYLKQLRFEHGQDLVEKTLSAHPEITRLLVDLFFARFALDKTGLASEEDIVAQIKSKLMHVTSLSEDLILSSYLNLIQSTLRTNYWQKNEDGTDKAYLSFKFDSKAVRNMPEPRPMFEIFVYSPRMEAVHLRGGKVARGGLRWSDRPEDFRTEILDLVKAQMVKNTVIVPTGSKGGFICKRLPGAGASRDEVMEEVISCYKTMMFGLLDITDNLDADGNVLPPKDVVRLDEDDPYLVVAADKGTATFSDIANGVSQDYGFWLDDAFASGGSAGYDHKGMGITARGAWESVKRHFRELGKDIQTEEFSCVGVGDMAGDVFGNGMLLSEKTRLIGAFNHLHIFCDPNPDAAVSYAERKRLFELPRSNWTDYDASKLSEGGRIFERSAKSLELTPEIKAAFNIEEDELTPNELMSAMLKAETELLWFGGIGTFIKAHHESHEDVGDKANNAVRVNANQVQAKVIGEGANLGITQSGRIEFALNNGRLNTDAIDNSAGVDTSDHEVNIKILLTDVMSKFDMSRDDRNVLLEKMTDEVAQLVLKDNYEQTQTLTLTEIQAGALLEDHAAFIRHLETEGLIVREINGLPSEDEIAQRALNNKGLTRPELAVLLAFAKIKLNDAIVASDLPDDETRVVDLVNYFPSALREQYRDQILSHRLKREIIATCLTNEIINRCGITSIQNMMAKTGRGEASIARAYLIARDAFQLKEIWSEIDALDNKVPSMVQAKMYLESQSLLERGINWLLSSSNLDLSTELARYQACVAELQGKMESYMGATAHAQFEESKSRFERTGVPESLAKKVALFRGLASALDMARLSERTNKSATDVAKIYFDLGEKLGLKWMRDQARVMDIEDHWNRQAVAAIIDDLFMLQVEMTASVIDGSSKGDLTEAVSNWLSIRQGPVKRIEELTTELKAAPSVDLAMLAVVNRQLRSLTTAS